MAGVKVGCVHLCWVAGNTVTLHSCVMEYFHYRLYSTFSFTITSPEQKSLEVTTERGSSVSCPDVSRLFMVMTCCILMRTR